MPHISHNILIINTLVIRKQKQIYLIFIFDKVY